MKKITIFILLLCVNQMAIGMEQSADKVSPLHEEYVNAVKHLSTIDKYIKTTEFRALLDYTHQFIEHPEHSSFVDVIIRRLEQASETGVVKWAWELKGQALLQLAAKVETQTQVDKELIKYCDMSLLTVSTTELLPYAQGVSNRARANHHSLLKFNQEIIAREYKLYNLNSPPANK